LVTSFISAREAVAHYLISRVARFLNISDKSSHIACHPEFCITLRVTDTISRIQGIGIVPVIVLNDPGLARPLGGALAEGGLPCAEVTFRTPRAGKVLKLMARDSRLVVGAG